MVDGREVWRSMLAEDARIRELEAEGFTTSDAQAIVDVEGHRNTGSV
jgi:hypothetical protein